MLADHGNAALRFGACQVPWVNATRAAFGAEGFVDAGAVGAVGALGRGCSILCEYDSCAGEDAWLGALGVSAHGEELVKCAAYRFGAGEALGGQVMEGGVLGWGDGHVHSWRALALGSDGAIQAGTPAHAAVKIGHIDTGRNEQGIAISRGLGAGHLAPGRDWPSSAHAASAASCW